MTRGDEMAVCLSVGLFVFVGSMFRQMMMRIADSVGAWAASERG